MISLTLKWSRRCCRRRVLDRPTAEMASTVVHHGLDTQKKPKRLRLIQVCMREPTKVKLYACSKGRAFFFTWPTYAWLHDFVLPSRVDPRIELDHDSDDVDVDHGVVHDDDDDDGGDEEAPRSCWC